MIALFVNLLLSTGVIVIASLALMNFAARVLPKSLLTLWSWPGTAVHELSHAAACIPAMAKIKSITLFRADGSGEVVHGPPRFKVLGMILISLAPLAGGLIAIAFFNWLLSHPIHYAAGASDYSASFLFILHALMAAIGDLWGMLDPDQLTNWRFWLMLLLGLSISLRMVPSSQDFSNSAASLAIFLGLLFVWFLFTEFTGIPDLGARTACSWLLSHVHLILAFLLLDALMIGAIGGLALFIGD